MPNTQSPQTRSHKGGFHGKSSLYSVLRYIRFNHIPHSLTSQASHMFPRIIAVVPLPSPILQISSQSLIFKNSHLKSQAYDIKLCTTRPFSTRDKNTIFLAPPLSKTHYRTNQSSKQKPLARLSAFYCLIPHFFCPHLVPITEKLKIRSSSARCPGVPRFRLGASLESGWEIVFD
jgi:hypothetical protein